MDPNNSQFREIREEQKNMVKEQAQLAIDVSSLKNVIADISLRTTKNDKKLDKILTLLENDDSIGSKGYIQQTRENTKFINDLKSKTTVIAATAIALSSAVGFLINLIINKKIW